jgi:hypothetical protein
VSDKRKRVLLPGEREGRSPVIYVPKGYEDGQVPPKGKCNVCGTLFFPGDDEVAHFRAHVKHDMDEIQSHKIQNRMPIFDEASWDPEIAAHMKKVGERMLREGRLEVKKNERAGF